MSMFEAGMLICFGMAWPLNIVKSLRSKSTKGKSVLFLLVIMIGYIFGIIHKILYSRDLVMGLYILNFLMVTVDTLLYFKNRQLEKQAHKLSSLPADKKHKKDPK